MKVHGALVQMVKEISELSHIYHQWLENGLCDHHISIKVVTHLPPMA
jgi:hypothetical protein